MTRNRRYVLAAHPVGPPRDGDFRLEEHDIPALADGEALARVLYVSVDPAIRGWLNGLDTYVPGIHIGDVIRAGALAEVVESRNGSHRAGDLLLGTFGWQEYAVVDGSTLAMPVPRREPLTASLSVLGVTGLTAYFGMLDLGDPQEGEAVVVSGAAGAVGSVAGQLAKLRGAHVVGIAGGPEKCAWVTGTLGFDDCIDYKAGPVGPRLDALCPGGVDVYFDNVGGDILDAVLERIRFHARVVLCGAISQYNATELPPGPAHYTQLVVRSARMEGFILFDFLSRFEEGTARLRAWVDAGRITYAEEVLDGLERAPEALRRLFTGEHRGKMIVKVAGAS